MLQCVQFGGKVPGVAAGWLRGLRAVGGAGKWRPLLIQMTQRNGGLILTGAATEISAG